MRQVDPVDGSGDPLGLREVFADVYDHLRVVARRLHRTGSPSPTLQTTALVHEAFVRLAAGAGGDGEFTEEGLLRLIPKVIRCVLVDHERGRRAGRRGGGARPLELGGGDPPSPVLWRPIDVLVLDELVSRLDRLDPLSGALVEMRAFGGMGLAESARLLGVSERTASRRWHWAKVWMALERRGPGQGEAQPA